MYSRLLEVLGPYILYIFCFATIGLSVLIFLIWHKRRKLSDISNFIWNIPALVHDLQIPLTIAKAELGFLKRKIPEDPSLATTEEALDELSSWIYMLLTTGRSEKIKKDQVDLSILVRSLLYKFEKVFSFKGIKINFDAPSSAVLVHIDKILVERAISNLLININKYAKSETQVVITLITEENLVRLCIENEIETYHVVYDSSSGLGLEIVKKVVDMHGGRLFLDVKHGMKFKSIIEFPKRLEK